METIKRDHIAIAVMKILITAQARHRRMSILNRIGFYLNLGYNAEYDISMPDIVKKSYECADMMIKEGKKSNPPTHIEA